jgi:hypothetical protein
LAHLVLSDPKEVLVPKLFDKEFSVLVSGFSRVLSAGSVVLGLGLPGHLFVDVLDPVALSDLVVLEVHLQLVRDID